MYVYIESDSKLWAEKWAVGFFHPQTHRWINESNYDTAQNASHRVHWLNGGNEINLAQHSIPINPNN